jgi:hypothetical protein
MRDLRQSDGVWQQRQPFGAADEPEVEAEYQEGQGDRQGYATDDQCLYKMPAFQ